MDRMGECAVQTDDGVSWRCIPCHRASGGGDDRQKNGGGDWVLWANSRRARNAIGALQKRLSHRNPNVQLYALEVSPSCRASNTQYTLRSHPPQPRIE
jgi:hypothetical protein